MWSCDDSKKDRKDRLINQNLFDDEKCYQTDFKFFLNSSNFTYEKRKQQFNSDLFHENNRWCQNVTEISANINIDKYTLYWVWNYFTNKTIFVYTTCINIIIESTIS